MARKNHQTLTTKEKAMYARRKHVGVRGEPVKYTSTRKRKTK